MEEIIRVQTQNEAQALCGLHDEQLKAIEKEFKVKITLRDGYLKISGLRSSIKKAADLINRKLSELRSGAGAIDRIDAHYSGNNFKKEKIPDLDIRSMNAGRRPLSLKQVAPRTKGQREYAEAIKKYDIVFGVGPAGTGKTYLAMSCAVESLKKQEVRRIILTRPAIEAGESLGFLPGDMYEKISPYLRPLYDALYDMMEADTIEKYIETGIIEIAPLAYMRGRTLNDAFIIMDEAQNATAEQMKMFLTRLGFDSKAVITGDLTQSDLPHTKPTGLLQAQEILHGIEGIKFVYLTGADVVRHALVQEIIEAYDKANREK
jgi:phosphate starvation-inducible PhoH-like protein